MKRRLFFLHSWMGLIAGLGLILIGLTGTVLVFKNELDGVLTPELVKVEPTARGRLSLDELLAAVRPAVRGYEVMGWDRASEPHRADLVWLVKHGTDDWRAVWVDPCTGEVRGRPSERKDSLTGFILELHYSFLADHTGELIAGIFAALLCFLGITGVWIYRGFWKNFFTLRWGRSARIFFSDLHKMVGISSVAFNLILGFTGAWWNLGHIISHIGEEEAAEPPPVTGPSYATSLSLDALAAKAGERIPGYEVTYISLPAGPGLGITFYGQSSRSFLASPYGSTVTFDQQTGEIKDALDLRDSGLWAKFLDSFRPLHFGTFGGLPVKILWSLGGLTPGILAVTGFVMWWKRRRPGRKIRARASEKPATEPAVTATAP